MLPSFNQTFNAVSDQYLIFGAEEGIYTLNLNELHDSSMEQVGPDQKWLFMARCVNHYKMPSVILCLNGYETSKCNRET